MTGDKRESLFPAFAVVGMVGFIVDAAVFQLLYSTLGGYVLPRILATAVAVVVTWGLNRRFVFRTAGTTGAAKEFVRYVTVQSSGIVVNFAVYALLLTLSEALRQVPVAAVAVGALVAMVFNYLGARHWVFAKTGWRP
ncbi:MAG: GtrA family protein [Gammaproteobacteria bacterium]|nr:GtrA family protein [Gammaproteobacteria bacterium]NNF60775.1 GtrA family protein [Gammaproteobacteria bacterium]NNM20214.1 GtrA family protein [Gammaproteobacteria bacterium]